VTFAVTSGGGSLFLGSSATDAQGRAADRWVVGTSTTTQQRAEARLVDAETGQGFVVEFSATATAGAPAQLQSVDGDAQTGPAAQPLEDSLAVRVLDGYGNPVPGAAVQWTVSGGGGVSPAMSQTDASGVARTQWVLGPLEGVEQSASASLGNLGPVGFTARFTSPSEDFGAGVWQTVASLPYAVRAPAAATDGSRIYVFGGYTPGGGRSNQTQIFDPQTGSWTVGANIPVALDFAFAGAAPDGTLHLMGGTHDGAGRSARHFVYAPATNAWSESVAMPIGVSGASGEVLGDKVYVVGGVTSSADRHDEVQIFDLGTGSWSMGPRHPVAHLNAASAALDGVLHVVGGGVSGYATTAAYTSFDPVANVWSSGPIMPAPREMLGAGTTVGNLCVFGGRFARPGGFNTPMSDTFCYEPTSGAWRTAASMPVARAEVASVSLDGWIYAIGGHDWANVPQSRVARFSGEASVAAAQER
jgi:hypothetical protein